MLIYCQNLTLRTKGICKIRDGKDISTYVDVSVSLHMVIIAMQNKTRG